MRVKILCAVIAALFVAVSNASAAPMPPPPQGPDPIGQNLFPPDFVIAHGDAIGLSDTQRNAIESAAINAQTQSMKLQFRIQESMSALGSLLSKPHIEESRVMTRLDQELDLERQMKRTQLGLMIQVKNNLTAEQQAKLQWLKGGPAGQSLHRQPRRLESLPKRSKESRYANERLSNFLRSHPVATSTVSPDDTSLVYLEGGALGFMNRYNRA